MSPIPTTRAAFTIGTQPTDAVVTVKLTSIEHVGGRDALAGPFNVTVRISDGGINGLGDFDQAGLAIPAGQTVPINDFIFLGTYVNRCNEDVGKITFKFRADDGTVEGEFAGVTEGDHALDHAGTYFFVAPVDLENVATDKESRLLFRGRIDVGC
jgi:hypothetical protein